jgi:dihydroxy-acid dehydratase
MSIQDPDSQRPARGTPADREYSSIVVDGVSQTPSRAMLRAVGFTDADFKRNQIGIASTWSMVTPCNMHIDALARAAAAGADEAGGKAVLFNTITVSDGISMGTPGMRYSLVSREVIADSIETVVAAEGFDGFVAIGGCDKNMPGCMMAIARLNRPAVFVYGGTIRPGGQRRDIVSVFEAVGAVAAGKMTEAELLEVERTAIPGPGSCGGMYTANTMASAIEALGFSLPNSSAQDAISPQKAADCKRAGAAVLELIRRGIRPSDILCREAFENAITMVIAVGGSTNAVLHMLAIARGWGATDPRRLHAHRPARAGPGRPAAQRPLCHVRTRGHRRDPPADAHTPRRRPAARTVPHGVRRDPRGNPGWGDPVPGRSGHRPQS